MSPEVEDGGGGGAGANQDGDKAVSTSVSILADTAKLISNSAYGKMVTTKEKHVDNVMWNDDNVFQTINDPSFPRLSPTP